jgi:hypothetical protein
LRIRGEALMANITLSIRLGPLVHFEIVGESCEEISRALEGFERLNQTVGTMFGDLAERVYPDLEKAAETGKPRESAS